MSEETAVPATIELTAERVIVLEGVRGTYTLVCRRVTKEDWAAYFEAIFNTSKREGQDTVQGFDAQTARLVLAERVITDATGYKVAGDVELKSLPNWKRLIPLNHRIEVADILASARAVSDDDGLIHPEGDSVSINCVWGADDEGTMQAVTGLKHVLAAPSEAQHRRYAREASRTRILGGDRKGETLYPGAQMTLAALYDELVLSVDGYLVNGQPLSSKELIAREMDAHHKVMAAQQIFQPFEYVAPKTKGGDTK
jgi:hypothetical protein